jgi:hypothetical protein
MSKVIENNSYGVYTRIYLTKWYMFRAASSLYTIPTENEGKNVNITYILLVRSHVHMHLQLLITYTGFLSSLCAFCILPCYTSLYTLFVVVCIIITLQKLPLIFVYLLKLRDFTSCKWLINRSNTKGCLLSSEINSLVANQLSVTSLTREPHFQ